MDVCVVQAGIHVLSCVASCSKLLSVSPCCSVCLPFQPFYPGLQLHADTALSQEVWQELQSEAWEAEMMVMLRDTAAAGMKEQAKSHAALVHLEGQVINLACDDIAGPVSCNVLLPMICDRLETKLDQALCQKIQHTVTTSIVTAEQAWHATQLTDVTDLKTAVLVVYLAARHSMPCCSLPQCSLACGSVDLSCAQYVTVVPCICRTAAQ